MKTSKLALKIAEEFDRQVNISNDASVSYLGEANLDATHFSGTFNLITIAKAIKKLLRKDNPAEDDERVTPPLLPGEKLTIECGSAGGFWTTMLSSKGLTVLAVNGPDYADVIQKTNDALRQHRHKQAGTQKPKGASDMPIKVERYKCPACDFLTESLTEAGSHFRSKHGRASALADRNTIPIRLLQGSTEE